MRPHVESAGISRLMSPFRNWLKSAAIKPAECVGLCLALFASQPIILAASGTIIRSFARLADTNFRLVIVVCTGRL